MTEEPGRTTRRFLTPPVHDVHAHLRQHMIALGMDVRVDAVGNMRGLWTPTNGGSRRLILGSHIDTVPDAGAFDGVLGVVMALEWVRLAREDSLALPVMWTAMVRRGMGSPAGFEQLARWMSSMPARLAGFTGQKGAFNPGADADMVVFDPDAEWTITEGQVHFRHKLSPYLGATVRGQVLETWLRGTQVYTRGEVPAGQECFVGGPHGRELVRS